VKREKSKHKSNRSNVTPIASGPIVGGGAEISRSENSFGDDSNRGFAQDDASMTGAGIEGEVKPSSPDEVESISEQFRKLSAKEKRKLKRETRKAQQED
jgi:hypothetical protein